MAKLDLYYQYYYDDNNNENDCEVNDDILKQAFVKLCEQRLLPGSMNYEIYIQNLGKIKMYRNRMLEGEGFGSGKGKFYRSC